MTPTVWAVFHDDMNGGPSHFIEAHYSEEKLRRDMDIAWPGGWPSWVRVAPMALVSREAVAVIACAEAMRDNRARQRSDETAEERAALFAEADRLDREMAKLVDAYRATQRATHGADTASGRGEG